MSPGGSQQNLADLIVAFRLENADALKNVLAAIQDQTTKLTAGVQALGQQMQAGFQQATAQAQKTTAAVQTLTAATVQGQKDMVGAIDKVVRAVGQFHFDFLNKSGQQTDQTKKQIAEVGKLQVAFSTLGSAVNFVLGAAQATILGFVRSGMAASAMGQLFSIQMERLSLTIAGLFRPEIERVMNMVNRFTNWLQNLSAAQRENIVRWIEGAAAALAVGLVLPRVLAGVQALIGVFKALGAAITGSLASTGIGALLPLIGLVVQAMTAWLVGTEKGRGILVQLAASVQNLVEAVEKMAAVLHISELFDAFNDSLADSVRLALAAANAITQLAEAMGLLNNEMQKQAAQKPPTEWQTFFDTLTLGAARRNAVGLAREMGLLAPEKEGGDKNRSMFAGRAGGFESLTATYERIARASVGAGTPEERTANTLDEINNRLRDWDAPVRNPRPEVAR